VKDSHSSNSWPLAGKGLGPTLGLGLNENLEITSLEFLTDSRAVQWVIT